MVQGLLGRKLGMTRVFDEAGRQMPVTAIAAGPCVVVQRKTRASDGYDAVQLGFGDVSDTALSKAETARFAKVNTTPRRHLREFAVDAADELKPGESVTLAIFERGGFVDVTGLSKGRGFQGVFKRYRMRGGPMTHGGHSKRRVGSVGCREFPGRIHRGKRMPGQMGHVRVTTQNLRVVDIRGEENMLLVMGAIPGPTGSVVMVSRSRKRAAKAS